MKYIDGIESNIFNTLPQLKTPTDDAFIGISGISQTRYSVFDGEYMWICSYGNRSIIKIHHETNLVAETIPVTSIDVNAYPFGIVFDGHFIWVALYGANKLTKIDSKTNQVVSTISSINCMQLTYDGRYVWTSSTVSPLVYKVDTINNTTKSINIVSAANWGICFDGNHIWVCCNSTNSIKKINVLTDTVVYDLPVGFSPRGIVFDGSHLWVTCYNSNSVVKVNPNTNTVVTTITTNISYPFGIIFDGDYIWVSKNEFNEPLLIKIDPVTNVVIAWVIFEFNNTPLELGFDGDFIWCNRGSGVVKVHKNTYVTLQTLTSTGSSATSSYSLTAPKYYVMSYFPSPYEDETFIFTWNNVQVGGALEINQVLQPPAAYDSLGRIYIEPGDGYRYTEGQYVGESDPDLGYPLETLSSSRIFRTGVGIQPPLN